MFATGIGLPYVDEDRNLGGVPVVLIVFSELEIPVQLSGVSVEREQRVAVEVIAGACLPTIGGCRISRRPENLIRGRVKRSRIPGRGAADFPRIAIPRFMTGLTRARNGVKAPLALAGGCIVSIDESPNAVLTSGNSKDNQIFHCERRHSEAVSFAVVFGNDIPNYVAGFCIEGDYVRIESSEENFVAHDGEAAIDAPATGTNIRGNGMLIHPDRSAGAGVQGEGAIILRCGVQNSVDDQRRGFELAGGAGLIDPFWGE